MSRKLNCKHMPTHPSMHVSSHNAHTDRCWEDAHRCRHIPPPTRHRQHPSEASCAATTHTMPPAPHCLGKTSETHTECMSHEWPDKEGESTHHVPNSISGCVRVCARPSSLLLTNTQHNTARVGAYLMHESRFPITQHRSGGVGSCCALHSLRNGRCW